MCVLDNPTPSLSQAGDTGDVEYTYGNYPLTASGEFSFQLVARVTSKTDGTVRDYGYDPDFDVDTGG